MHIHTIILEKNKELHVFSKTGGNYYESFYKCPNALKPLVLLILVKVKFEETYNLAYVETQTKLRPSELRMTYL